MNCLMSETSVGMVAKCGVFATTRRRKFWRCEIVWVREGLGVWLDLWRCGCGDLQRGKATAMQCRVNISLF